MFSENIKLNQKYGARAHIFFSPVTRKISETFEFQNCGNWKFLAQSPVGQIFDQANDRGD